MNNANSDEQTADNATARKKRASAKRYIKLAFKLTVFAIVLIGIYFAGRKAWLEFDASQFNVEDLRLEWLLAACGFYFAGMSCACVYWIVILRTLKQGAPLWKIIPAFFAGQLGKYVPGKAMVVVIRVGMIKSPKVDATVATLSVFIETLTMMAVGGFVSAVIIVFVAGAQFWLLVLAIGLMICSGVPTIPPLFRRIVRMLKLVRLSPQIDAAIERVTWKLILKGWLISIGTWLFFGLSLFAVLKSLPQLEGVAGRPVTSADIPVCIGCASLAAVAGFLSLIPGGLGVRELVIMTLLGPFGAARAVISAIVLRLVWLVTELVVSFILYVVQRIQQRLQPHQSNHANPTRPNDSAFDHHPDV